jgi:hypothetical protein
MNIAHYIAEFFALEERLSLFDERVDEVAWWDAVRHDVYLIYFGHHEGLGLIPGRVIPVPATDVNGGVQKIPHVGCSALLPTDGSAWDDSILADTPHGTAVYLVHSFAVAPDAPEHCIAECDYGGHRIAAAVRKGAVMAASFIPKRAARLGWQSSTGSSTSELMDSQPATGTFTSNRPHSNPAQWRS